MVRQVVALFNYKRAIASFAFSILISASAFAASTCYGSPNKGRVEQAVQLPSSGPNFSAYSAIGVNLGRTYVHTAVRDVLVTVFANLARTHPTKVFVYGETGLKEGGLFRPHRTHQNGLSVDVMIPVIDKNGKSVALPTSITNKFGYDIEFDPQARFDGLTIDFEALGAFLHEVRAVSKLQKMDISLVIFDPQYFPKLLATQHGKELSAELNFMRKPAWVRHDEHIHIDFSVPCKK